MATDALEKNVDRYAARAAPSKSSLSAWFRRFSSAVAWRLGSHWAFIGALATVLVWAATGPMFHYSMVWQLVINTGTTIVTFLMVFVIQSTQNRDAKAFHLKLDELIRASQARNVFADLENASEEEIHQFEREFEALRKRACAKQQKVSSLEHATTKARAAHSKPRTRDGR